MSAIFQNSHKAPLPHYGKIHLSHSERRCHVVKMDIFTISLACIAGLIAGTVDAIAGGGGIINLPTLMFLGLPVDMVLGTNKLLGASGTVVAVTNYVSKKKYSDFVIRYCLVCTCMGAGLGALCASFISPEILKPIVSVSVIGIALYLFFKPDIGVIDHDRSHTKFKIFLTAIGAFALGFYDGIFGPGTGAFLTFMFIRFLGQGFVLAAGNTKVLNLASNIVALSIFLFNSKIVWSIGIPMAIANMFGGYLGAHIAIKRGAKWVRWIFIVMAIIVGVKLIA